MKIVHCIFSFNTGGAETMLCDIMRRQSVEHDVTLIVVNDDYDRELLSKLPANIDLVLLNRKPSSRSPFFIMKLNLVIYKIMPDAVHLHSFKLPRLVFYNRKKTWYTVHDIGISMKYSGLVGGIVAISDAVKNDIERRSKVPVKVVPNGIDLDQISRKTTYRQSDKFKIVQVARLDHNKKGQDLLVKALAKVRAKGFTLVTLDLIGDGQSRGYLTQLVADLGLTEAVNFLGLRDREYIYNHLKDYDLMCHPARFEGFGLVIAEGIAAGVPVLVPMTGGPYEVIGKGRYGCTHMPLDHEDLADKIIEVLNNYEGSVAVAQDAYRHIVDNYSIATTVDKYIKVYEHK